MGGLRATDDPVDCRGPCSGDRHTHHARRSGKRCGHRNGLDLGQIRGGNGHGTRCFDDTAAGCAIADDLGNRAARDRVFRHGGGDGDGNTNLAKRQAERHRPGRGIDDLSVVGSDIDTCRRNVSSLFDGRARGSTNLVENRNTRTRERHTDSPCCQGSCAGKDQRIDHLGIVGVNADGTRIEIDHATRDNGAGLAQVGTWCRLGRVTDEVCGNRGTNRNPDTHLADTERQ